MLVRLSAVTEGVNPDAGDAITNRDARQAGAVTEGIRPMLVTPSGIVMLVRLVQTRKASFPMLVTPLPIVMLVRLVQSRKALLPDAGNPIRNRDTG